MKFVPSLFAFLFLFSLLSAQECIQPQTGIQVCDNSVFCNGAIVCMENVTEDPAGLTFEWEWPDTTYTRDGITTEERIIRIDPECDPQEDVQIFLTAIRQCDDGSTVRAKVSAFVSIVFPPTVSLSESEKNSTICLPDQEICLDPAICPTNTGIRQVNWEVSDGFTTTDPSFCHDFPAVGSYEAIITVESFASGTSCGIDRDTAQIEVFAEPIPGLEYVEEGIPQGPILPDDTLEACSNRRLDLLNISQSADSAVWTLSPGRDGSEFDIRTENNDSLSIEFISPGTYTLELRAISTACNPSREASCRHTLVISESGGIDLALDLNECEEQTLNPRDFLTVTGDESGLYWAIGGDTLRTSDPGPITFTEPTPVYALLPTQCGLAIDSGSVVITSPSQGLIESRVGPIPNDTLEVCRDEPDIELFSSPIGGSWEINGAAQGASIPDSVLTISPATTDTDTLVISYGSECIIRNPIVVIINGGLPTYEVQQTFCDDSPPTQFNATHESGTTNEGTWNSTNGSITPDGVFSPQIAGSGSHQVWYEYASESCAFSDTFDIEVGSLEASFTIDRCENGVSGTSVFFEATFSADPTDQLTWEFGDGNTATGENPSHLYAAPGTYTVSLQVIRAACTTQTVQEIVIDEAPVAAYSRFPTGSYCAGDSLVLTNASTGASGYEWLLNGELISTDNAPIPLFLEAGPENTAQSYTLQLVAQGGCGSDSVEETIEVLPEVRASFGAYPDTVCSGDTLFFNNNSLGLGTTCQWQLNGQEIFTDCMLPPQVFPEGSHTLSLTIRSAACNKEDTYNRDLLVKPTEVEAFFEPTPDEACLGQGVQFVSFATPFSQIIWDFGDETDLLNSGIGDTIIHVFQDTGAYTVTQYARSCGLDSMKVPIRIRPLPELTLDFDSVVCQGSPLAIQLTTDAEDYQVEVNGALYENLIQFAYTPDSAGPLQVLAEATNLHGCRSTLGGRSTASPTPEISITPLEAPFCVDQNITFAAQGTGTITNWIWDFGDGNEANQQSLSYAYLNVGTYAISLLAQTDQGCQDSIAYGTIQVAESPTSFFVPDALQACAPVNNLLFTNLSEGEGIIRNTWQYAGNQAETTNLTGDFVDPGLYRVRLEAENDAGCMDSYSDSIAVYPQPEAVIQFPEVSLCTPMEVPFSIAPTDYTDITWSLDGLILSNSEAFTYSFLAPDTTYQISLELSYEGVCTSRDSAEFSPVQGTISSFRFSNTKWDEAEVMLVNQSEYATDYLWDFGGPVERGPGSREESPIITYVEPGDYTVTLIAFNGTGCADTFSLDRSFYPIGPLFAPSAFTPNGDGVNDQFFIVSPHELASFRLDIYDRWGKRIYMSQDIETGWDGILPNGRQAPEGVYTFTCQHETLGGAVAKPGSGTITLVR